MDPYERREFNNDYQSQKLIKTLFMLSSYLKLLTFP